MAYWLRVLLICIGSYFVGGILFGRIISKANHRDITKEGSGNPGTTNMLRSQGAKLGFLTLFLDMLKGMGCALVAFFVCGGTYASPYCNLAMYLAALSVTIGHIFPVYFKFKGGKGLAAAAGAMFVANPLLMVCLFILHWINVWLIKVMSICVFISCSIFVIVQTVLLSVYGCYYSLIPLYLLLFLILFAFRSNIKRLIHKNENKIDLKESFEIDKRNREAKKEQREHKEH